jgi:hypothetical protein
MLLKIYKLVIIVLLMSDMIYVCRVPDFPAEPDSESHPTTDPVTIPQEDMTGNPDSVKDFTHVPWPEPKTGPPPSFNTFSLTTPPQSMGGGWRVSQLNFFILFFSGITSTFRNFIS